MFDGIIKNFLTDSIRSLLVGIAAYLVSVGALSSTTENNFVAAGLVIFSACWSWWENVGHQKLVDFIKSKGHSPEQIRSTPSGAAGVRAIIFIVGISGALCGTLHSVKAADLATKAPAVSQPLCTTTQCIGWYVGFGMAGNGTNADIIGNGISGSVFAGGGIPFANFGWQYWDGVKLVGFEVGGGYQFNVAGSVNGIPSNETGYDFYQEMQIGGNLSGLISTGATPITSPSVIAQSFMAPYLAFGVDERPWGAGWRTGAGAKFVLGPNMFLDIGYRYINYGNATVSGNAFAGTNITADNLVFLKFNYAFGNF